MKHQDLFYATSSEGTRRDLTSELAVTSDNAVKVRLGMLRKLEPTEQFRRWRLHTLTSEQKEPTIDLLGRQKPFYMKGATAPYKHETERT